METLPDLSKKNADGLAKIFRYFGEVETPRLESHVYTEYSLGVAADETMLSLAEEISRGQPAPNVLYASVHDRLLELAAEKGEVSSDWPVEARELARFYPSITNEPIPEESAWPAFRAFCLAEVDALVPRLRVGRTQTCVVHRCAVVLPALASLPAVKAANGCLALLEIGPSAGLNLRLDRYRYVYMNDEGEAVVWGSPDALPRIECEIRGQVIPPVPESLTIVARRGLDLNPIDLDDPIALRWLRALIWPEHVERARLMDEALAHVGSTGVEIEAGDATRDIEAQIARLPADAPRVLFATHVVYQISQEGLMAMLDGIARASRTAPVDLVIMESTGKGDSRVEWFHFEKGARAGRQVLGHSDSHGRWIEWGPGNQGYAG